MKVVYCSWCDKPAEHKRRDQGEETNRDACCGRHYMIHFAAHADFLSVTDGPSRADWVYEHSEPRHAAGSHRGPQPVDTPSLCISAKGGIYGGGLHRAPGIGMVR